jgi:Uma2 family endonuclease
MTSPGETKLLYTVDDFEEFIALPENRHRLFELINGEIVEKMPTEEHGFIAGLFFHYIFVHRQLMGLMGYPGVEVRHRRPGDRYNNRLPDVSYRAATSPIVTKGAVPQMPDLAIEIQSPDDKPRELREAAEYYLRNGSKLVWLVYPALRQIEVCTLVDGMLNVQTLTLNDTLEAEDILPGFKLPLKDIFLSADA